MASKTKPTTVAEFIGGTRLIQEFISNLAKSTPLPSHVGAALRVINSYFPRDGAKLTDNSGFTYTYTADSLPAVLKNGKALTKAASAKKVAKAKPAAKATPAKTTKTAKKASGVSTPAKRIAATAAGTKALNLIATTKQSNVEIAKATGLDRRRIGELRKLAPAAKTTIQRVLRDSPKASPKKAPKAKAAKKAAPKTAAKKVAKPAKSPVKATTKAAPKAKASVKAAPKATPAKAKAKKTPAKISSATRSKVLGLHKQKLSQVQIARKVGIDRRRVGEIIRKAK